MTQRRLSTIYKNLGIRKKVVKKKYKRTDEFLARHEAQYLDIRKKLAQAKADGKRVVWADESHFVCR